ncbi:hypothetical protein HOC35_06025 [Candidatus Woesearchaeota archaeon]|mgnify:FL=1|nr:hypothetical protein [Candidatus Woesearchaeota archaeon]
MIKQKKAYWIGGVFNLQERWAEILAIFILVIGFLVALWARSAVVTYMVILLSGIISGRGFLARKYTHRIAYILILIFYLIGFLLGSFYGKSKYILVLFILGMWIGYVLHEREII